METLEYLIVQSIILRIIIIFYFKVYQFSAHLRSENRTGWGRGATCAPGSLDKNFENVNHPPPMQKKPVNGELSSFFILQFLQIYKLLFFWKNKFFGIFSFLDFCRY